MPSIRPEGLVQLGHELEASRDLFTRNGREVLGNGQGFEIPPLLPKFSPEISGLFMSLCHLHNWVHFLVVKGRSVSNILIFDPFVQPNGLPFTLFAPFFPVSSPLFFNIVTFFFSLLSELFDVIKSVVLLRQLV